MLEVAKRRLESMAWFGVLEDLQTSVAVAEATFCWRHEPELMNPRLNRPHSAMYRKKPPVSDFCFYSPTPFTRTRFLEAQPGRKLTMKLRSRFQAGYLDDPVRKAEKQDLDAAVKEVKKAAAL